MARPLTHSASVSADHPFETQVEFRERHFAAQDGLRLYYRDYGDPLSRRKTILCLSGLTRNSKDFHLLASRLSARYRVICLDYRGRGRSAYDPDWRNYMPAVYISDIRHLLAVAGVRNMVVVGTSLGGLLAMSLGVVAPGSLKGVVLNDVGPDVCQVGLDRIIEYIRMDRPHRDWESAAQHLRQHLPWLSSINGQEAFVTLARNSFRQGEDGMLRYDWDVELARPLERHRGPLPDLWPLYRSLRRVPTLAIRGALSDVLTAEAFDRMAAEKSDLARVTIDNVGHAPTLLEPKASQAIDGFLSEL